MKKTAKQLISTIMAFCMMVSICAVMPAYAEEGTAAGDIVLNFEVTDKGYGDLTLENNNWAFNLAQSSENVASSFGYPNIHWAAGIGLLMYPSKYGGKIAFDFTAPADGWYEVDIDMMGNVNYTYATKMYVLGETNQEIITLDKPLFTGDKGKWVTISEEASFASVYLQKGTNTIVIEAQLTSSTFFAFKSMTFTPAKPKQVTLNLKSNTNWNYNFEKSGSNVEASIGYPNIYWAGDTVGLLMYTDKYGKIALDFNVNADGWYAVDIKAAAHNNKIPCVKIYTEDGKGNISSIGKISGENFTGAASKWLPMDNAPEFNKVYLTTGKNTLYVAAGTLSTTYFAIQSVDFIPCDAPVVVAKEEVIDFEIGYGMKYADRDIDIDGWEFNMEKSNPALASCLDGAQNHIWNNGLGFLAYLQNSKKMAIDFKVAEEGWYDVDMDIMGHAGYVGDTKAYMENGAEIITFKNDLFPGTTGTWVDMIDTAEFGKVYLNKGVNTLVLEADTDLSVFLAIKTITFTPGEAPEEKPAGVLLDLSSKTNWDYNFEKSGSNVEASIGYPNIYHAANIGLLLYVDKYGKVAFDFDAPETGWYEVAINASAHKNKVTCVKTYAENGEGKISSIGEINGDNFTSTAGGWVSMDNAPAFNKVYLTEGTNTFYVAAGSLDTTYFAIKSIEFTVCEAPVEAAEEEVIDFKLYYGEKYADQDLDIDGWEFNMEKSDAALADCLDGAQNHIWNKDFGFLAYLHNSKKMAIDFKVSAEGWYDVDMDIMGNAAYVANTKAYIENGANIITFKNDLFPGETGKWVNISDDAKFKKVYLNKGVNTLVLEAASDLTIFLGIKAITFTPGEAPIQVSGITLDQSSLSGEVNDQWTVNATVTPDNAEDKEITWTSSDNNVAVVIDGVITAVGEGNAIITATSASNPEITATVTVTVATPEPEYDDGDVNGDGRVNTRDVTTLRRYLAGGYEDSITVIEEMIDVNGDGRENTRDVAALRAIIAG